MTSTKTIIVAAALSVLCAAAQAAGSQQTIKPLQGVSFHAGAMHAVGYFLTERNTCKLVLTLAEDDNFAPARFETAVAAGTSTSYQLAEGKSLAFACAPDAQAMSVSPMETLAAID